MEQKSISESTRGDVIILRVQGKLDAALSPTLEKKAFQFINTGHNKLLLDLSGVSSINSAGFRMLLSIKKQVRAIPGKFVLCALRSEVLEMMKICGFDHVLDISRDEEEAIRQF